MTGTTQRLRDLGREVSPLTWVGFGLAAGFLAFAAVALAGYGLTDPGDRAGLGATSLWLVPTLVLVALAVYRPETAMRVLAYAALLPIGFGVWTLLDYEAVMAWQDRTGPVFLVLVLIVGLPVAVAGLSQPVPAGVLLVGIAALPWLMSIMGAGDEWARALTVGLVTLPLLAGGVLLSFADRLSTGAEARLRSRRPLPGH